MQVILQFEGGKHGVALFSLCHHSTVLGATDTTSFAFIVTYAFKGVITLNVLQEHVFQFFSLMTVITLQPSDRRCNISSDASRSHCKCLMSLFNLKCGNE